MGRPVSGISSAQKASPFQNSARVPGFQLTGTTGTEPGGNGVNVGVMVAVGEGVNVLVGVLDGVNVNVTVGDGVKVRVAVRLGSGVDPFETAP